MITETRDPGAVMRYLCEKKLTSVHDIEMKLKEARLVVKTMLDHLQSVGTDIPPAKVARIASSSPWSSETPPPFQVSLGTTFSPLINYHQSHPPHYSCQVYL